MFNETFYVIFIPHDSVLEFVCKNFIKMHLFFLATKLWNLLGTRKGRVFFVKKASWFFPWSIFEHKARRTFSGLSKYLLILWTNKHRRQHRKNWRSRRHLPDDPIWFSWVPLEFQRAIRMAQWLPGHNKAHSRVPNIRIHRSLEAQSKRMLLINAITRHYHKLEQIRTR